MHAYEFTIGFQTLVSLRNTDLARVLLARAASMYKHGRLQNTWTQTQGGGGVGCWFEGNGSASLTARHGTKKRKKKDHRDYIPP